jgi:hypothetical protein
MSLSLSTPPHDNEALGAISLDAYWNMVGTAATYQARMQNMSEAEVSDFVHGQFAYPVVVGVVPNAGKRDGVEICFLKISPSAMASIEEGRHEATASDRSFEVCLKAAGSGHLVKLGVVPCRDFAQAADFQLRFGGERTLN